MQCPSGPTNPSVPSSHSQGGGVVGGDVCSGVLPVKGVVLPVKGVVLPVYGVLLSVFGVVICVAVVFSEERAVVNSVVVGGGVVGHPQLP